MIADVRFHTTAMNHGRVTGTTGFSRKAGTAVVHWLWQALHSETGDEV